MEDDEDEEIWREAKYFFDYKRETEYAKRRVNRVLKKIVYGLILTIDSH